MLDNMAGFGFGVIFIGGVGIGGLVLFRQLYLYLKLGTWVSYNLYDLLKFFGSDINLKSPENWIGIAKIFDYILSTHPGVFFLCIGSTLVVVAVILGSISERY